MSANSKEVLIIRSASFQQLDKNLPDLQRLLPNHSFHMLTHEHGIKLAQKYDAIDNVYSYPYQESFSFRRKAKELGDKTFDTVIIPVTNLSGAGFANVLFFSLTIKAKNRYQCNLVSELKRITPFSIMMQMLGRGLFALLASILTVTLAIPTILFLPWKLRGLKKSRMQKG